MDVPLLGGDSAETWLTAGNGFTCRRRHCLMATCLWAVDRLFSLSAVACLLAAVAAAAGTVRVLASDRDRSSASFHVTWHLRSSDAAATELSCSRTSTERLFSTDRFSFSNSYLWSRSPCCGATRSTVVWSGKSAKFYSRCLSVRAVKSATRRMHAWHLLGTLCVNS